MRRIEVRTEDELNRTVLIRLQNDKIIAISLEERDANELVLVLRGYYRLITNQNLPVDKEESPPVEDLAPPFLSQHKVVPEKWNYVNQNQIKTICFAMHPVYQNMNRKTNGLYNTMGRQSKTPLMIGFSLDSNMNSSMSNKNHQFQNDLSLDSHGYDLQSVMSMEILESGLTEAKNEEVLRRVKEMQLVVESSEKYLTEQEELARNISAEWQETSVDIESDTDSIMNEELLGQLKHSDSLLLLAKNCHGNIDLRNSFTNAAIEMLRSEINQSESDNDSLYTPHNSPKHKLLTNENSNKCRVSFGLHSPDTGINESQDLKTYLAQLKVNKTNDNNLDEAITDMYVFDPDIIDLTLLPPPATPDELDCALPTPINLPPSSFADSMDKLNKLGVLHENLDLEEFLASVTVPPPTQKVTPAVELTPEEIMSYIIPPPPNTHETINLYDRDTESLPSDLNNGVKRRNSNCSVKSNIIEYATVDRKGAFSCCSKNKNVQKPNDIQPLPRRSSDEKPPERPPKNSTQERQRSQSLSSHKPVNEFPPKLPPKGENNHQAPPHLFLPPKKPPLPPVPPLEVLRNRKIMTQQPKTYNECRTACIGSPHLQRSKNTYNDIDSKFGNAEDGNKLNPCHSTAISTPTSPHLGILD